MHNAGRIELFEGKVNAVELDMTDIDHQTFELSVVIGEVKYKGTFTDGKGIIEIGTIPAGMTETQFYLEDSGVTFGYGVADLLQVDSENTANCAKPCAQSVTQESLAPELASKLDTLLSEVAHDDTIKGDGTVASPLSAAIVEQDAIALEALGAHTADTGNPHAVTAAQIGALTFEQDPVASAALALHKNDTGNPHMVTAAQIGALTAEADPLASAALATHAADTNNPHAVTAAQVGALTVETDPVASAALALHTADTGNPHAVTAAQVGALTVVAHDETLTGDGTVASPLSAVGGGGGSFTPFKYDMTAPLASVNATGAGLALGRLFYLDVADRNGSFIWEPNLSSSGAQVIFGVLVGVTDTLAYFVRLGTKADIQASPATQAFEMDGGLLTADANDGTTIDAAPDGNGHYRLTPNSYDGYFVTNLSATLANTYKATAGRLIRFQFGAYSG